MEGYYALIADAHYIIPTDSTRETYRGLTIEQDVYKFWGFIEIIPETVGMSTGLKDKNGREIFGSIPIDGKRSKGGDIIELVSPAIGKGQRYLIFWKKERAKFATLCLTSEVRHDYTEILSEYVNNYEVIGNQFDNPELLEQDNG